MYSWRFDLSEIPSLMVSAKKPHGYGQESSLSLQENIPSGFLFIRGECRGDDVLSISVLSLAEWSVVESFFYCSSEMLFCRPDLFVVGSIGSPDLPASVCSSAVLRTAFRFDLSAFGLS